MLQRLAPLRRHTDFNTGVKQAVFDEKIKWPEAEAAEWLIPPQHNPGPRKRKAPESPDREQCMRTLCTCMPRLDACLICSGFRSTAAAADQGGQSSSESQVTPAPPCVSVLVLQGTQQVLKYVVLPQRSHP